MYQYTYYIIMEKRRGNIAEISYNVVNESHNTTLLKLGGKSASTIFEDIVNTLAKYGACTPIKVSSAEAVYGIREDLGPIVGAYLILIRRARNIEKWNNFFYELIEGKYIGVAKAFASFLEVAIEMSRSINAKEARKKKRQYVLNPHILNALSSALKQFINKIIKQSS